MPDISIVIPLYNEEESLPELADWIERVCGEMGYSHEIIMIDDGSTDSSWEVIKRLSKDYNAVHGIKFQRNYGKSAALNEGFKAAKGNVVITMDADLQHPPAYFAAMLAAMEDGADVVLMRSDPLDVPTALRIGRGTLRKMRQNLWWAVGYNVIALPIAAGVLVPALGFALRPEIAAMSMSGSSLIVAVNALMLKRLKLPAPPASDSAATRPTAQPAG